MILCVILVSIHFRPKRLIPKSDLVDILWVQLLEFSSFAYHSYTSSLTTFALTDFALDNFVLTGFAFDKFRTNGLRPWQISHQHTSPVTNFALTDSDLDECQLHNLRVTDFTCTHLARAMSILMFPLQTDFAPLSNIISPSQTSPVHLTY